MLLDNIDIELALIKNKNNIKQYNKILKQSKYYEKPKRKIKKAKKRKIIRSYKSYMKSDLWVNRKNRYFQKHGKKCEACESTKYVTLHHAKYSNNYGQEPDREVFALCSRCHHQFHETYKTKKDMLKETKAFIKEVKSARSLMQDISKTEEQFFHM